MLRFDVIDDVIIIKMTYFSVFWAKEPDSEIKMQISQKLTKIEKMTFLAKFGPIRTSELEVEPKVE